MKTTTLNSRLCICCGKPITSALYCFRCYKATPAGKEELERKKMLRKYPQLDGGGVCRNCIHWQYRCLLGIPEAGTVLAELCSAREVATVLE